MRNRSLSPLRRQTRLPTAEKKKQLFTSLIKLAKPNSKSNNMEFTPHRNERDSLGRLLTHNATFNKKRRGRSMARRRKKYNPLNLKLNKTTGELQFQDEVLEKGRDLFEIDRNQRFNKFEENVNVFVKNKILLGFINKINSKKHPVYNLIN